MQSNKWSKILEILEKETSQQNFSTWLKPIKFKNIDNTNINIAVNNKFFSDWIRENYKERIERIYETKYGEKKYLVINIEEIRKEITKKNKNNNEIKSKKPIEISVNTFTNINNKYLFNNFVCGPSNQFAHAASLAVANNPATTYNPLFIYGGVGLGKTHLIHAIGNEIIKNNKKFKVSYYSSEKFMNELVNCIRYGKMEEFRTKFRNMDVLLIDDIQFIAGKERTQEEFFHTFNALYESHKQIIVTSDKFPKEIPGLEERLRSRFEWGLIADIQAPDVETKLAIVKIKADQNNIKITDEIAYFLANSITSNIRELEGLLIRIGAFSSLTSTPIDITMAKSVLKDVLIEKNKEITVEEIQKTVANYFNTKISDIKSSKRHKSLVLPRQISMYITRKLTDLSYPEIGANFGGKDHSTIIYAIKKIEKLIDKDVHIKVTIDKLMSTIEV